MARAMKTVLLITGRLFFQNTDEPIRKTIYKTKIAPKGKKPNWFNLTTGVDKMRDGLFAFHAEISPVYRVSHIYNFKM